MKTFKFSFPLPDVRRPFEVTTRAPDKLTALSLARSFCYSKTGHYPGATPQHPDLMLSATNAIN